MINDEQLILHKLKCTLNDVQNDLYSYTYSYTGLAMDYACEFGHLNIVKYLHQNYCTNPDVHLACMYGHMNVLNYVYDYDPTLIQKNSDFITCASSNGHYDVVVFLYETIGQRCSSDAIKVAGLEGHLKIVVYLNERVPYHPDWNTIARIKKEGHVKTADYFEKIRYGMV